MLLGLPVLLYPAFGLVGFVFALTMLDHEIRVGVAGLDNLPTMTAEGPVGPTTELAWFTALPSPGGAVSSVLGAAGQVLALRPVSAFPPLIVSSGDLLTFVEADEDGPPDLVRPPVIVSVPSDNRGPLDSKAVDVLLIIPRDFRERLNHGKRRPLKSCAGGDEMSKLATRRLTAVVRQYRALLRQTKLARAGLPPDFDKALIVRDPDERKPRLERTTDELRDALVVSSRSCS